MFNEKLADKLGISQVNREKINKLHIARENLINNPSKWVDPVATLEKINFALQRLWGFPEDKTFHEWYLLNGCACPYFDNRDRRCTPFRIVNRECKWHGSVCGECGAKLDEKHKVSCDSQYKDKNND